MPRAIILAVLMLATARLSGAQNLPAELIARAREIHRRAIVVDTHADTTQRMLDEGFDLGARDKDGHLDIPRMREGGLGAEFFSFCVHPKSTAHFLAPGLAEIDAVLRQAERHA